MGEARRVRVSRHPHHPTGGSNGRAETDRACVCARGEMLARAAAGVLLIVTERIGGRGEERLIPRARASARDRTVQMSRRRVEAGESYASQERRGDTGDRGADGGVRTEKRRPKVVRGGAHTPDRRRLRSATGLTNGRIDSLAGRVFIGATLMPYAALLEFCDLEPGPRFRNQECAFACRDGKLRAAGGFGGLEAIKR